MAIPWTLHWPLARGILVCAIMCGTPGGYSLADDKVAAGKGTFQFAPDVKRPQHKLTVWTNRPDRFGPDSPMVIVMHGVKRNGKTYRDNWAPHSQKGGYLLLVPEFPEAAYPG